MRRIALLTVAVAACTPAAPSAETSEAVAEATAPAAARPAAIERVIDGDSLQMTVDGASVEVRLLGINAPERDECWSAEAQATLVGLSSGTTALLPDEQDQFGRLLAYVFVDGEDLGRAQVAAGNAIALASDHDRLPDYLAAEEEAAALERGLWGSAVCGPEATATGVRIWAFEADAPGRDDRNPNGEFVSITNEGRAADLTGWVLRDESSVHRYTFPEGFLLDDGEIVTIRSGCGDDTAIDLYWCADGTVWTNSGDTVLLLDSSGNVVERIRYSGD